MTMGSKGDGERLAVWESHADTDALVKLLELTTHAAGHNIFLEITHIALPPIPASICLSLLQGTRPPTRRYCAPRFAWSHSLLPHSLLKGRQTPYSDLTPVPVQSPAPKRRHATQSTLCPALLFSPTSSLLASAPPRAAC